MEVEQLPRGRHRLSREAVERSQRDRLLLAMADAVAERGYARTSVADVLRRARVSRETFYEQFDNKQDCFLASFDAAGALVAGEMSGGLSSGPATPIEERIDQLLSRYLATLAGEPALARTFLVEVYAAGPEALARRAAVQARFVDLVAAIAEASDQRQRFACEALVASVSALVTQRICAGRTAELEELRGPLSELAATLVDAVGLGKPLV
jgi:AcrR family transcriptional regulator